MSVFDLNDNHKRALLATFRHLDEMLGDALIKLQPSDSESLFPQLIPDAAPLQRKVIGDYLARFRHLMRRFLDDQGIAVEPPNISALWAFRTALAFAQTALDEIRPQRLRGYGALSAEAAAGIDALLAELSEVVAQMDRYLETGAGGDLAARLARLDATRDEVRLLRELERIIAAHGLVEFRATLAWLLERMEHGCLEVAFFGRVSSGKSSLLNFLLGGEVLPAGVTPVTAVPARIVPGEPPHATVSFATTTPLTIGLERLKEFAAEELNPGNVKAVTDILVSLPAPRLKPGVCLVDTPGLGALATAGAAQTLAYLPRCDLGVILVDASGALTEQDLAVARKVAEVGAELLPVLSKADLLAPADLDKMLAYLHGHFQTALGYAVEIAPVSVAPDHTGLAQRWWDDILVPRLHKHRELAVLSLRRKVGALRIEVMAALSALTGRRSGAAGPAGAETAAALGQARAGLEAARREVYDFTARLRNSVPALLNVAAEALARAWTEKAGSAQEAVALALGRAVDALAGELDRLLAHAATQAEQALVLRRRTAPSDEPPLPRPRGRPLFDPAPLTGGRRFDSGVLGLLGARRSAARAQIDAQVGRALEQALQNYGDALQQWSFGYLRELGKAFAAAGAAEDTQLRLASPGNDDSMDRRLAADLDILDQWEKQP